MAVSFHLSGHDEDLADGVSGIVRCDMIAESIVAAAEETGGFKVPVVVRLQGTNCQQALHLVSVNNYLFHQYSWV